jgi:hypothetical protein
MNCEMALRAKQRKGPMVAEIIGPSGAGKSWLSESLNECDAKVKAGLTVWGLPISLLLTSGLRTLPVLLRVSLFHRHIDTAELKQIIRLEAFYRYLKRGNDNDGVNALFFDEGVVFALAKLRADSFNNVRNEYIERWESGVLDRWAGLIDAIIWLDAPDEMLIERINSRTKPHRMKNRPGPEVVEFLARYRQAYESVLDELVRRREMKVLRYRTDEFRTRALVKKILELRQLHLAAE